MDFSAYSIERINQPTDTQKRDARTVDARRMLCPAVIDHSTHNTAQRKKGDCESKEVNKTVVRAMCRYQQRCDAMRCPRE